MFLLTFCVERASNDNLFDAELFDDLFVYESFDDLCDDLFDDFFYKLFDGLFDNFFDDVFTVAAVESQKCLERELGRPLSVRCDEYYEFNLRQKTMSQCL